MSRDIIKSFCNANIISTLNIFQLIILAIWILDNLIDTVAQKTVSMFGHFGKIMQLEMIHEDSDQMLGEWMKVQGVSFSTLCSEYHGSR
jgi:hypothetical protein